MRLISLENVSKVYTVGARPALDHISLGVNPGEFIFLVGASGSGKTTLLQLLLHEQTATDGEVHVMGTDLRRMRERYVSTYRRGIGFVFQDYKLLPNKTVYQNVAFALKTIGARRSTIRTLVPRALATVGLAGMEKRFPHELSGGEAQRVAVARAYVNRPQLLLADEPTGNLDPTTSIGIMEVLDAINRTGTTVLMATHNEEIVNSMRKRVVELHQGKIVRDEHGGSYDSALYYSDREIDEKSRAATNEKLSDVRIAMEEEEKALYSVSEEMEERHAHLTADLPDLDKGVTVKTVPNSSDLSRFARPSSQYFSRPSSGSSSTNDSLQTGPSKIKINDYSSANIDTSEGIVRLANSLHQGHTGRYGEVFAPVEETLTWGKGLKLDDIGSLSKKSSSTITSSHTPYNDSSPEKENQTSNLAHIAEMSSDLASSLSDASIQEVSPKAESSLNPISPRASVLSAAQQLDHLNSDDFSHSSSSDSSNSSDSSSSANLSNDDVPFKKRGQNS